MCSKTIHTLSFLFVATSIYAQGGAIYSVQQSPWSPPASLERTSDDSLQAVDSITAINFTSEDRQWIIDELAEVEESLIGDSSIAGRLAERFADFPLVISETTLDGEVGSVSKPTSSLGATHVLNRYQGLVVNRYTDDELEHANLALTTFEKRLSEAIDLAEPNEIEDLPMLFKAYTPDGSELKLLKLTRIFEDGSDGGELSGLAQVNVISALSVTGTGVLALESETEVIGMSIPLSVASDNTEDFGALATDGLSIESYAAGVVERSDTTELFVWYYTGTDSFDEDGFIFFSSSEIDDLDFTDRVVDWSGIKDKLNGSAAGVSSIDCKYDAGLDRVYLSLIVRRALEGEDDTAEGKTPVAFTAYVDLGDDELSLTPVHRLDQAPVKMTNGKHHLSLNIISEADPEADVSEGGDLPAGTVLIKTIAVDDDGDNIADTVQFYRLDADGAQLIRSLPEVPVKTESTVGAQQLDAFSLRNAAITVPTQSDSSSDVFSSSLVASSVRRASSIISIAFSVAMEKDLAAAKKSTPSPSDWASTYIQIIDVNGEDIIPETEVELPAGFETIEALQLVEAEPDRFHFVASFPSTGDGGPTIRTTTFDLSNTGDSALAGTSLGAIESVADNWVESSRFGFAYIPPDFDQGNRWAYLLDLEWLYLSENKWAYDHRFQDWCFLSPTNYPWIYCLIKAEWVFHVTGSGRTFYSESEGFFSE
ncbi:hypothetical protein [Rubellicoccus peritrichatus]|uniref:Uncharacterized protein n=1 Tax=Rubellicoccus peritrichatus TaxID=3080537 RepID=A0AAQ3QX58_9BACT|nr:hypothetical protein [Puniceicoccus sp. CR14]WOO42677.1 hypothetical protein RZN69_06200 [Puniceicoccus sp. CR14]